MSPTFGALADGGDGSMARIKIFKKDGSPTPYFWLEKEKENRTKTVYKETADGVKRMKGVKFHSETNQMRAD